MSQSQEQAKPAPLTTTCEHCIFAKYDGLVQIGCEFDRVEKYKQQTEVELVDNGTKSFYQIKNRICNYCTLPGYYKETHNEAIEKVVEDNKLWFALILKEHVKTPSIVKYFIKHKLPVEVHIIGKSLEMDAAYNHEGVFYHVYFEDVPKEEIYKNIALKSKKCSYLVINKNREKTINKVMLGEIEKRVNGDLERLLYVYKPQYDVVHKNTFLKLGCKMSTYKKVMLNV